MSVNDSGDDKAELVYNDYSVGTFVISDGVVYFRELYGVARGSKQLSCFRLDDVKNTYRVMMKTDTDPLEIAVHGGRAYYYNDLTSSAKSGIYSVSINAAENPQLLLANEKEGSAFYYARYLTVVGDKMYFIGYRLGGVGGDSHLYSVELGGSHVVKKLA